MLSIKNIHENSTELRRLKDLIKTTVTYRGESPQKKAAWEHACAEFHRRFDALSFPGGCEALRHIREKDADALNAALLFLEADPYHFRSGYLKEDLWRWLQHCNLSSSDVARLEDAAISYLDRRISREFWSMCKAMARLGSAAFWSRVSAQAKAIGSPEAFRAACLLSHNANIQAGANLRRAIYRSWVMRKYGAG